SEAKPFLGAGISRLGACLLGRLTRLIGRVAGRFLRSLQKAHRTPSRVDDRLAFTIAGRVRRVNSAGRLPGPRPELPAQIGASVIATCDPRPVELALVIIGLEAIALVLLSAVAWRRGAPIDRLGQLLGGRADQLDGRIRGLVSRVSGLESQTGLLLRDVALLADLSGVGVLRLDADQRVG